MTDINKIYKEFIDCGAILSGHFKLSSGFHSDTYIQCAIYLQNPKRASRIAEQLVGKIPEDIGNKIDLVVAPAMGGLIIGHEIARVLDKNFVFFERVDNVFTLKRGFEIISNTNILLIEDVITTGCSSLEVAEKIHKMGANIITEAVLIDRSGSKIQNNERFTFPVISLLKLESNIFSSENIPENLKDIPVIKPGSRK